MGTHWKQIDQAKEDYRNGITPTLELTRAAFMSQHRDFRSSRGDESHPSMLCLTREGTCSVPVTFLESVSNRNWRVGTLTAEVLCHHCEKTIRKGDRVIVLTMYEPNEYTHFCSHRCADEGGCYTYPEFSTLRRLP